MNKQLVKIIKRNEVVPKPTPTNRKAKNKRPAKPRTVESTIKDWITERRENVDTENRSFGLQLAAWK